MNRMALEKEISFFQTHLSEFAVDHTGQHVLIHGDEVVDFFSSYEDALKAGYNRFGLDPFLVKQVQTIEQVHSISRLL